MNLHQLFPEDELLRLRKPGRPDELQRSIYSLLGIDLKKLPVRNTIFKKI